MMGGHSGVLDADEEVQMVVNRVKEDICTQLEGRYRSDDEMIAVCFKRQVVAGLNYFVKVRTSKEYLHVTIYQPLGGQSPRVTAIEDNQDDSRDSLESYHKF